MADKKSVVKSKTIWVQVAQIPVAVLALLDPSFHAFICHNGPTYMLVHCVVTIAARLVGSNVKVG